MTIDNYRRSFKGMLSRMYEYMQRRVQGRTDKAHIYEGLSLLSRTEFFNLALASKTLKRLYYDWKKSRFTLAKRPTPHRVDRTEGYDAQNIQFVTYSKNSAMIKRRKK